MPKFDDLIKEKIKRLDDVPLKLQTVLDKKQKTILNDLLSKINDLTVKNGAYEITPENLKTVAAISDELKQALLSPEYLKAVKEFASEFDKQAVLNSKIIKDSFGAVDNPIAAEVYITIAKKSAIESLVGAPMDANFIKPIQGLLESAVVNGATIQDTYNSIKDFVEGGEGQDGKLLRYAKQITNDSFSISDRSYTSIVSDYLDNEWFYFSGSIVKLTRCFCKERVGHFYHYKEIEAWANGENLGNCDLGDGNWAGEIQGTNAATIYSYLGGYNCLHFLVPVSEAVVDDSDIERARSFGYID